MTGPLGRRGSAAGWVGLVGFLVIGGALLYAVFGLNAGDVLHDFAHFVEGL